MRALHTYVPSGLMVKKYGDMAGAHAQDQTVIVRDDNGFTAAVIDGAKNAFGTRHEFPSPELATLRGLPGDMELNGGEIASGLFAEFIRKYPTSGKLLIEHLNRALAKTYAELGIDVDPEHRENLFTGYVGHVRITADEVFVTAVGDCYVAVNGQIVAGREKLVDRLHNKLIDHAAEQFGPETGLDRQAFYQYVMDGLNLKQFQYQNEPTRGKFWYPAIDGTETPAIGIETYSIPREEVRSIALWTDGFTPATERIWMPDDLEPVLPEFAERAAIFLDGLDTDEMNAKASY